MKPNIPPKPEGSKWTDDQWRAVATRGEDVLVAAAAGSGKTAVLIERIIRMISTGPEPADVDRLLVATFTKAAADEMRHRMRDALEKQLAEHPESSHLRRQLALLHRASITTLHSFCMDVVSRYAHKIPLDPAFRIANETEAELMRLDVIEELFERYYGDSEAASPFWGLLDRFGGQRSDDALFSLVQRLYDFSRSHPFPELWLRQSAQAFRDFDGAPDNAYMRQIIADAKLALEGVAGLLNEAVSVTKQPGGPAAYAETLLEDIRMADGLLQAAQTGSWPELYAGFESAAFGKLKPVKGDAVDKELQDQVKALREKAKKQLGELREQLFARSPEQYAEEMRETAPFMEMLAQLVISFGESYAEAKAAKRLVDFSDLEHYCLRVLCEGISDDGELIPSAAALEFRAYFVEVLIDEYQDTNQVQEAILSLISRGGPGNRFMVGDVKQSIYRFRLADPSIFLGKYKRYKSVLPEETGGHGIAIDLSRNFRSRSQVVDGVNYIFEQIMEESAAEMDYDEQAALVYGAGYPEFPEGRHNADIDVYLIHRQRDEGQQEASATESEDAEERTSAEDDGYELETAELEARLTAMKILELVGKDGGQPFQVADKQTGGYRDATFRDIVILMRATQQWAPVFIEQLRSAGIPAYAELSTGYFEAIEVDVMLSLLKVIDNPIQDIPITGVLRSPIVGLSAAQLAQIRLVDKSSSFYEAALQVVSNPPADETSEIHAKLKAFLTQLEEWREEARFGSLSDLLWRIYRETGYFDYVGGLPGGMQRQANLKALYDRSRQFESTSLRGLFRFLRFIQRMQENGGDLGAAKALGEQEDVVRIMSIHKSKGLEFPVVFVAGTSKMFNQQDLNGDFLLHKELGFGPMIVQPELRVSYPSIANLAIKRRMRMEMLAEEMRILYVALTRAREKLILLGTTRNIGQQLAKWSAALQCTERVLPAYMVTAARSYLDWMGPAILRHPSLQELRSAWKLVASRLPYSERDASRWGFHIVSQSRMSAWQEAAAARMAADERRWEEIRRGKPVPVRPEPALYLPDSVFAESDKAEAEIRRRLEWKYPYLDAQSYYSKTSVTEVKRLREQALLAEEEGWHAADGGHGQGASVIPSFRRPKFLEERKLNSAERGTVYHAVMQHVPLKGAVDRAVVADTLIRMAELEIISAQQAKAVDPVQIEGFFQTSLGRRLTAAKRIYKELPFSYGLKAGELHPEAGPEVRGETVIIQGVIDCLFEEEDGLVLIDYKTDAVRGDPSEAAERYRTQLELYARAIGSILGRAVKEKVLYFFDGGHLIVL